MYVNVGVGGACGCAKVHLLVFMGAIMIQDFLKILWDQYVILSLKRKIHLFISKSYTKKSAYCSSLDKHDKAKTTYTFFEYLNINGGNGCG